MFSHESVPLIIIFMIMLLGVLAAVLHPVHALVTWLRRRNKGASARSTQKANSL